MWRGILLYAVIFCTLFVGHIIAAAKDFDILFRIIATLITFFTMFVGLVTHLLCISFKEKYGFVVGRYASVPLSAALGWAYSGMEFSFFILIWVIVAILIQFITERGLIKYFTHASIDGRFTSSHQ
jgi:hypothetical protein